MEGSTERKINLALAEGLCIILFMVSAAKCTWAQLLICLQREIAEVLTTFLMYNLPIGIGEMK